MAALPPGVTVGATVGVGVGPVGVGVGAVDVGVGVGTVGVGVEGTHEPGIHLTGLHGQVYLPCRDNRGKGAKLLPNIDPDWNGRHPNLQPL